MLDDLQRLVDGLAGRLNRAVAIDDLHLRLLVYSAHEGPVDPVRAQVILTRRAPKEPAAWVMSFGLNKATGPLRIPANDEFGVWPRLCIPVRCLGIHFGYLWLIDPDESLTEDEVTAAADCADDAGLVLYQDRVHRERARTRNRELLSDLLSEDEPMRRAAAETLVDRRAFVPNTTVRVLVATSAGGARLDDARRLALEHGMDRVAGRMPPEHTLQLVRANHAVLLTTDVGLSRNPDAFDALYGSYRDVEGVDADDVIVAVGTSETSLPHAIHSYRRALQAVRVASVVPGVRPIAHWDQLGVYGMLAGLPIEQLRDTAMHPGVSRLQETAGTLVSTLEGFLDHAGDTKAVARRLGLHRASVYQRLHRIEQITGLDLSDGEQRLDRKRVV